MSHCQRCGRTLKNASPDGMGPVCRVRARASQEGEDLFASEADQPETQPEPQEHFPWWLVLRIALGFGSAMRHVRHFRAQIEGYPERRRAEVFQSALERDAAERRARFAAAFRVARERLLP